MSDLIEKLKRTEERLKGYPNPEECFTKLTLDLSEIATLLSALETVRGIEEIGLLKITKERDFWVVARGWCGEVKFWMRPTLSAAIEAARKGE